MPYVFHLSTVSICLQFYQKNVNFKVVDIIEDYLPDFRGILSTMYMKEMPPIYILMYYFTTHRAVLTACDVLEEGFY